MRESFSKLLVYGLSLLLSIGIVVGLTLLSWYAARPLNDAPAPRLRLYTVPLLETAKGTKLSPDSLRQRVGLVQDGPSYVATPQAGKGLYSSQKLSPGIPVKSCDLQDRLPVDKSLKGVVITVKVKQEHTAHLRLGMRLAFVSEAVNINKSDLEPIPQLSSPGLELLSIGGTSLQVFVLDPDPSVVSRLSRGDWRPVVVPERPTTRVRKPTPTAPATR